MKEILDVVVWGGFIFLLFIFLRGMNETQTAKHKDKTDKAEAKLKEKNEDTKKDNITKGQE